MKIIKIGNNSFTYKGTMSKNYAWSKNYDMPSFCYAKPSLTKINVFNNWYEELNKYSKVIMYGIKSYNFHLIILNAIIEYKNKTYYLDIHKSRNDIYELL